MKKPTSKDTRLPLPTGYTFNTPAEMYYEYILESSKLRNAVIEALIRDATIVATDPLGVHTCKDFWPQTIPLSVYTSDGEKTTTPGLLAFRLGWLRQALKDNIHFVELPSDKQAQLGKCLNEDFTVKMSRYVIEDKALQITFFRPLEVDGGIPVCLWINPCKKKEEIRAEFEKLLNSYDEIRQGTGLATADKSVLQGFEGNIPCEMDDPKKSHYTRISDKIPSAQKALSALRFWRIKKQLDDLHEKDPEKVFHLQGLPDNSIKPFTVNRGYRDAEGIFSYLKSGIVQFMPKREGENPAH